MLGAIAGVGSEEADEVGSVQGDTPPILIQESAPHLERVAAELWRWLAAEEHRGVLTLWVEGYARSLIDRDGPWA